MFYLQSNDANIIQFATSIVGYYSIEMVVSSYDAIIEMVVSYDAIIE